MFLTVFEEQHSTEFKQHYC